MTQLSIPFIFHILIFLTFPLVFGYLALKFKLPAIVGYIISGIILGIFVAAETREVIQLFADIGVILLLFTVGLETDTASLRRFAKFVIIGGLLQLIITGLITTLVLLIFGFSFFISLLLAFGFAFSSTAVASKIIQDRGEENTLVGRLSTGILIFQDIMVIPFLLVISSYSGGLNNGNLLVHIITSLLKSIIIISVIFVVGEHIVPYVFSKVGRRSRELLNIFTITFIFACVGLFLFLGLPSSLAAFVAGLLIGQTLEHYHIFSQIRPLRDIFAILFFVFLGASVNLSGQLALLPLVIIFSILLIIIKVFVLLVIFIKFRFHTKSSYTIGIFLSQVGEFAFIAFALSSQYHLIDQRTFVFAVAVTITTLIISPLLIDHKDVIFISIRKRIKKHFPSISHYLSYNFDREPSRLEDLDLSGHIVLCGYGRVGRYIGRALDMANLPYIAVDFNLYTVEKMRATGVNIIYGDPTNYDILDYIQVDKAAILISTLPDKFSQELVILNAKQLNPNIIIFSRVAREKEQKRMKDLGAFIVVQPEFEAALSIIKRILRSYNIPKEEIAGKIKRLKIEHGMN